MLRNIVLAVALFFCAPAFGQAGLQFAPLGYCQLTSLAASTALSSCPNGIPSGATSIVVSVEAQAVRYRDDKTAPTATVGMPIAAAQTVTYSGSLLNIRFIEQTASAKINVSFYR